MNDYPLYPKLITSKQDLIRLKEEQIEPENKQISQSYQQNEDFKLLQNDDEQAIIKLLDEQNLCIMYQEDSLSNNPQVKKKVKKDKQNIIPYKSHDNRRRAINLEFQINDGRKFNEEVLSPEFIINSRNKERLLNLIERMLFFEDKIHPKIITETIENLEIIFQNSINSLEQINDIPHQIQDPQIAAFNHKIEFSPQENYLSLLKQAAYISPEFQKRFNSKTIEEIIIFFCEKIKLHSFLPLNTSRGLKGLDFKQVTSFLSNFWTVQFEWKLGIQQTVFNPFKLKELSKYISQFQPTSVQFLNLHEDDPKKFRSLKNLGELSIESSLRSMMISDIGWAFNYEERDIKNFCKATTLSTKMVNQEILIFYLSSYFMPITILQGVPLLKIGKSYITKNESLKIKLIKSIKRDQLYQIILINDYFEPSILINSPYQRILAKIKPCFEIKMDFISRKFMISQERDHQIQFNCELKDITLSNIQIN